MVAILAASARAEPFFSALISNDTPLADLRPLPMKRWQDITLPREHSELELCVEAPPCSNGDQVALSINGNPVMLATLSPRSQCQRVHVHAGQNQLLVQAVSALPSKCSRTPLNAGRLTLFDIGSDGLRHRGESQEWRLHAGAGSETALRIRFANGKKPAIQQRATTLVKPL